MPLPDGGILPNRRIMGPKVGKRLVAFAAALGLSCFAYYAFYHHKAAESLKALRARAEQGDADAQDNLGMHYDQGWELPKDEAEAVRWYRKAADQGNADAQEHLGTHYEDGRGVPKDGSEAVRWYRKAAEQGNADAQGDLAAMYADGEGVPRDLVEAYMWYTLAKDQGDDDGSIADLMAHFTDEMSEVQIAEAQLRAAEWKEQNEAGNVKKSGAR